MSDQIVYRDHSEIPDGWAFRVNLHIGLKLMDWHAECTKGPPLILPYGHDVTFYKGREGEFFGLYSRVNPALQRLAREITEGSWLEVVADDLAVILDGYAERIAAAKIEGESEVVQPLPEPRND